MQKPSSVMAFDFGTQKIGVALGQTLTQQARPLDTLKAKSGKPDWSQVKTLVERWQPDHLTVGLPLNMDGTESDLSRQARKFARRLSHAIDKPVSMIDERLSSYEARDVIKHSTGMKQKHSVDAYAAALIAQAWLDNCETQTP